MKKNMQILMIEDNDEDTEVMCEVLAELGHRVILAKSGHEARLKFSNQDFDFILMNMDIRGLNPLEFAQSVRHAENRKNIKERMPILINGSAPEKFQEYFAHFDNVQFLPRPFTGLDFKKKMSSFGKRSGLKPENIRKVGKGEYLITEGGQNNEMYWVLEGSFVITKLNKDNQNVVVGEVQSGELLGEMSFLDKLPRSASVRAKEDCEVLVIPHTKFMDVLDQQPRWFRSLMSTLSHRLRDADQRIAQKHVLEDPED